MEGNYSVSSADVYNRRSSSEIPSCLVDVQTETCHVGRNKEGNIVHVLDNSGDRPIDIYDIGHQYGRNYQQQQR